MEGNAKKLDQFFTQDKVAKDCLNKILVTLRGLGYSTDDVSFLEPSAGDGAFIRAVKGKNMSFFAYDIDSKHKYIQTNDYLANDLSANLPEKDNLIVIGNPPFGKRAKLAIGFVNTSFKYSDTVAFILPLQFDKYSAQKQIDAFANLVLNEKLDENSFIFEGEEYGVRCCLQVWTKRKGLDDLRLRQPPIIKHWDFEMWQYNNTREAEKYFDKEKYAWDFAVPRQGYKDYTLKETDPKKMDRRTQWIFFKAKNQNILHNLMKLDFERLSRKNTSTPGFGKADVIQMYNELFGASNAEYEITNSSSLIGQLQSRLS